MSDATRIPMGPDLELRIDIVAGDSDARSSLELRLWRSGDDVVRDFRATDAGLRIPRHLLPLVIEGLEKAQRRATQDALWK